MCLAISTLWFALVYWSIQQRDSLAFSSTGDDALEFAAFVLYAGMINVSGELVYLAPNSIAARATSLAEMIYSYAFTVIYFAVVLKRLVDHATSGDDRRVA
jgi:hypothetical protein